MSAAFTGLSELGFKSSVFRGLGIKASRFEALWFRFNYMLRELFLLGVSALSLLLVTVAVCSEGFTDLRC